jgi:hypothetical protein
LLRSIKHSSKDALIDADICEKKRPDLLTLEILGELCITATKPRMPFLWNCTSGGVRVALSV